MSKKNDDGRLVWSSETGDMRKKGSKGGENTPVTDSQVMLLIRRLTSGKGRTIIEITGLPDNKNWCKKLAKDLKKELAVGGAYKNGTIEVHGEKLNDVKACLDRQSLQWKQVGG